MLAVLAAGDSISGVAVPLVHAQQKVEPALRLELSPRQGTVDDIFSFSIIVESRSDDVFPTLTGGDDFKLTLIGSQVEMMLEAGERRFRTRYRYQLLPKKSGILRTPGAELRRGGTTMQVEGEVIAVSPASTSSRKRAEDLFVIQSIDPPQVYVGQQATVALEIYSQRELLRPQFVNLTFDNFLVLSLPQEEPFRRNLEGQAYRVLRARRALFPLREGTLPLEPVSISAQVLVRKVVRFPSVGGLFNFEAVEQVPEERLVTSNAASLRVLPLPAEPAGFNRWGLSAPVVGVTDLRISVDRTQAATGETITLTAKLSSNGNIQGIREIPIKSGGTFRAYHENVKEDLREYLNQLITTKTFVVSIVPLVPGTIVLPDLSLGFFDPNASRYRETSPQLIALNVSGQPLVDSTPQASGAGVRRDASTSKSGVSVEAGDIAAGPAKELLVRASRLRESRLGEPVFSVLSAGSLVMILLGLIALVLLGKTLRTTPPSHAWQGTRDELKDSFLAELFRVTDGPRVDGSSVVYDALRLALRGSDLEASLSSELCTLLDSLEDLERNSANPSNHSEAYSAKLPEGLSRHIEALMPVLRQLSPARKPAKLKSE